MNSSSQSAAARATEVQHQAADPLRSTVLRASAGSGKTKVLVDRFIRLCLGGNRPKSILAVTFTRKAAMEIKDRLLQRVQRYALLTAPGLEAELRELLGRDPTPRERRRAALLYEEILEDLSGLHVGTIHSFCQLILSCFAAEAGLDPRFRILEREDELWDEALDQLEREAVSAGRAPAALAQLASSPATVRQRLTELRRDRIHLERWLDGKRLAGEATAPGETVQDPWPAGARSRLVPMLAADLRRLLFAGTPLQDRETPCLGHLAEPLQAAARRFAAAELSRIEAQETELTPGFVKQSDQFRKGLQAVAANIGRALAAGQGTALEQEVSDQLVSVRALLLTSQNRLRAFTGKKATKAERQAAFAEAAAPLLDLLLLAQGVDLYRYNRNLLSFGLRALDIYDALKLRERWVDFQDLERKTWQLMRGEEALAVQYRFDEIIDHLLIDEFQDTNRNQWEILAPFAEEFLAGESARSAGRTVFLVGDVKQSIYRFRGAEPAILGEAARWLARQTGHEPLTLPTNFRSLPDIVRTVGALFTATPLAETLPGHEVQTVAQEAARQEAPGQVVILPPYGDESKAADGQNPDPAGIGGSGEGCAGHPVSTSADQKAARAAVRIVRHLVTDFRIQRSGRPDKVRWGDILVLCRKRSRIAIYEHAFRRAGIPIIPAGRGLLAKSREVRDILALLRWLAYPADNTALASVLRSPLFRMGEARLQQALAQLARVGGGDASLWEILHGRQKKLGCESIVSALQDWREKIGYRTCHGLLRHIFHSGDVLERFAAALGEQARYNLLRLHDLALGNDLGRYPTLRRFADLIRRAAETAVEEEATLPEQGLGRLRLMSVHAAKGLEAPIVLLVDAGAAPRGEITRLPLVPEDPASPVLYGTKLEHLERFGPQAEPGSGPAARLLRAAEHARREARSEEVNILYVAMTRPRDALYVLGAEPGQRNRGESFLDWLMAAAATDRTRTPEPRIAPPYSLEVPDWLAGPSRLPGRPTVSPGEAGAAPGGPPGLPAMAQLPQAAVAPAHEVQVAAASAAALAPYRSWQPPRLQPAISVANPSATDETRPLSPPLGDAADIDEVAESMSRSLAMKRGEMIHRFLQMAAEQGRMPTGEGEVWREAAAVCANPEFAWIFHPEPQQGVGLCEVAFIQRRREPDATAEVRIIGAIDRLVLAAGRADVIDYKTTVEVEQESKRRQKVDEYRPQLEAYRAAVCDLYPDREVHAHILFTHATGPGGQGVLVTLR